MQLAYRADAAAGDQGDAVVKERKVVIGHTGVSEGAIGGG
jgi:hypothetical protein